MIAQQPFCWKWISDTNIFALIWKQQNFSRTKRRKKVNFASLLPTEKKKQKMPYRQRQKSRKRWNAGSRIWDKGRGAIIQTLRKKEGAVSKNFFGATGPQFGLKIKEGGSCPSRGSANALVWNYSMALRKFLPCVELIMSNNNNDKVYLKNSEWLSIPCMSSRFFARLKSFYTS